MNSSLPPLALYVHLPWCVHKCPYCDFNSHALRGDLPEDAYLEALARDLDVELRALDTTRELQSIFFGGGTPSLFAAGGIGRFLDYAAARVPFAGDIEITLEANPGTVERGRFADYRAAGINRISLGVQSFDDAQLKTLGRIHDAAAALESIEELHAAGIDNFNLDLMYGLPDQDTEAALDDLEQAIAAGPAHVSHYELTLEPNTLFAARPPAGLPDAEKAMDIASACRARLAGAGFARYEISAFARTGRQSRHNLNYWRHGDYLAVGAGAHGKLTTTDGKVTRTIRHRHPRDYQARALSGAAIVERRESTADERAFEYMLNVSRLLEGSNPAAFARMTGLDPDAWLEPGLAKAESRGLIRRNPDRSWVPTETGLDFLNDLQAIFLPEDEAGR